MSQSHRKFTVVVTPRPTVLAYTVWAADRTDALNRLGKALGRDLRDPRGELVVEAFIADQLPEFNAPEPRT